MSFILSDGHRADSCHFIGLLEQVHLPGGRGRPRKRCRYVIADKGYDSDPLRRDCTRYGMRPIIARRNMHRRPRRGLPHQFDRPKYRQRNGVERLFSWLKEKRRLSTCYDKLASRFRAMVTLACIEHCLYRALPASRLFRQNVVEGIRSLWPSGAPQYPLMGD